MPKPSLWKEDSHLREVSERADNISTYVIDVFDSLLLKTIRDMKDFHKKVYCTALEHGVITVELGEDYYADLRMSLENNAKQNEIISELPLILQSIKHLITDIDSFILIELSILRECCYLNPFIMSFATEQISNNKHFIFVNNSHYREDDLRNLIIELNSQFRDAEIKPLESININESTLYISTNQENINRAENKGIITSYYDYLENYLESPIDLEALFYNKSDTKFYMLRKLIENTVESKKNLYFNIGATILGPLLNVYIKKVYTDIKKEKITLVLPLMREGALLTEMLEKFSDYHMDNDIEVKPLYISRKSSYLPALTSDVNADEVFSFFEGIPINISDFMEMFEVSNYTSEYSKYTLYSLKQKHPGICKEYRKFFIANVKLESIQRNSKRLLQQYLVSMIENHCKIATVDIGFNGTIQENIENVLREQVYEYSWKHYLLLTREGVVKKLFSGMRISSYINTEQFSQYRKDIIRGVDIFEQLVIGSGGTTLAYKQKENKVIPVCEKMDYSESEIQKRNSVRKGILFFTDIFLLIHDKFEKDIDFNQLGYILHRLVQYPMKKEAKAIGSLSYSSNFGSLGMQKIINPNTSITSQKGYKQKIMKAMETSYLASGICWPQGELVLQDENYSLDDIIKNDFTKSLRIIMQQIDTIDRNIAIYGAGELGNEVSKILKFLSIKPICIADKNIKLQGTIMNGVEIIEPSSLPKMSIDTIIIASLTFANEIEKDLSVVFGEKFSEIKIVKLKLED